MIARASIAALVLTLSGIAPSFAAAPPPSPTAAQDFGATVLCYHIVESPQDPRMEVSREVFRQQMRYLAMTGYNVIPLRDLYEYAAGKRASLPKNAVVITIDDGWRSTYTEVWPEMKRRGFPFTVFIYPKIIGQTPIAMNWKQIKEMADAGVDIQSHTYSHAFLTRRRHASASDAEYAAWLERELIDSKTIIEKNTGRAVSFLAYPYGDFDQRVTAAAAKSGYAAGLTCEYGRVRRGSDPLRMRRVAIEKRMDFATFRRLLGAGSMRLEEMTPQPGMVVDNPNTITVTAKIPHFTNVDPTSVGMALISSGSAVPYTYDPRSGSITLTVKEALKGSLQRALVWATDAKSGKRVEASWTFRLPGGELPAPRPAVPNPLKLIAPAEMLQPVTSASSGGGGNASHDTRAQRAPR